jgi:hypothetical protein
MRLGVLIAVTLAAAAANAGGTGIARAASDVSPRSEAATAVPDSPTRDQQNGSDLSGARRSGRAQPDQGKPPDHAAGPFAGSFDTSTGPTNPNGLDLGPK